MGSNGLWCSNCAKSIRPQLTDDCKLCCSFCGKVVSEYNWSEEATFAKNAAGKRKSDVPGTNRDKRVHFREDNKTGGATKTHGTDKLSGKSGEEPDTLSDIDDLEIDSYINNEKEKHYKKIIREELNREYIEKQLAKEAAAAVAKEAYGANLRNCSEGMDDGRKLAADAAAAVTKSRKGRQQIRVIKTRYSATSQNVAEATRQMLAKKTLKSKINYAVLDELFNEFSPPQSAKKSRFGEVGMQRQNRRLTQGL